MHSTSKYYALYLLTALWGHSLAEYHNASLSGHVGALEASPSSNSAFGTGSATSDTEEGCQVQLYVVNAYNWNPNVDFRAINNSQKTTAPKNVPTNSAGTQTTTVEWTSGAILQHGTWSLLTGTTTITFPTGFSWMVPNWVVGTASGSTTSYRNVTVSTGIFFPSPISTLPPGFSDDGKGLKWNLASTASNPMPSQINEIRAMFPNESGLQSCSPKPLFSRVQVPPAALQLATPSSSNVASSLQGTLATLDASSTATVEATLGHATATKPGGHASPTPSPTIRRPTTTHRNSDVGRPSETAHLASSRLSDSKSSPLGGHDTADTLGATADSNIISKSGSKTLSPVGSTIITSKPASMIASTPLASPSLSIETLSDDKYLIEGHTLVWNSTLTFGSGTVVTRLALGTDQAGQTLLLGDSITKAPATSCVGRCAAIRESMQLTSTGTESITRSRVSSSGLPVTNDASDRDGRTLRWWILATAWFVWTAIYSPG